MSGHPAVRRADLTAEVEAEVRELARRMRVVFDSSGDCEREIGPMTSWYVNRLVGEYGEDEARRAATEVTTALVGEKWALSTWWETALGRATAWWIGYTHEAVPQNTAANILGVRRQAITGFILSGTLKTVAREGAAPQIDRESLLALLRRRYHDYE